MINNVSIPSGPGIRVDTYLYPGCTVSPFYDSLIAKLNAWGNNFEEARTRMHNALSDFDIQGVKTSISLYKTILNTNEFINNDLSTDFLDRFKILDKLNADINAEITQNHDAIVAAATIYDLYYKHKIKSDDAKSHWKKNY